MPKLSNNNHITLFKKAIANLSSGFSGEQTFTLSPRNWLAAFTLAETLITLLVIGVVAVLTIPTLMQQIGDYTLKKQRTVFERKFDEGLKQMRIDGKLEEKYESTQAFVSEMQKYFKIATVCNSNNLTSCFTPQFSYGGEAEYTITYGENENNEKNKESFTANASQEYETANIKTTKDLIIKAKYDSDVMGIIFSDGVKMLITYNPDCIGIESGNTQGNPTKCFGYAADVNQNKAPNKVEKDIVTNVPLVDLSFEIIGMYASDEYGFLDGTAETGSDRSTYTQDYWLGAKKFCETKGGSLPTLAQLQELQKKIYGNANCEKTASDKGETYNNCSFDAVKNSSIGKYYFGTYFWRYLWSDTSEAGGIYSTILVCFETGGRLASQPRSYQGQLAFCVK
ncbi:MAG: type II secretion system GspH family protein [bacterium]|nr:type II secretion system GspH family protein [bacterium]